MLDVLEQYLNGPTEVKCAVGAWILKQGAEEQRLFEELKKRGNVNMVNLYRDLSVESSLPFKITLFRMHMRGDCVCQ